MAGDLSKLRQLLVQCPVPTLTLAIVCLSISAEVTRREGRMLAKSIRAIAFPSSDPHLCWKSRTLGSFNLQLQ